MLECLKDRSLRLSLPYIWSFLPDFFCSHGCKCQGLMFENVCPQSRPCHSSSKVWYFQLPINISAWVPQSLLYQRGNFCILLWFAFPFISHLSLKGTIINKFYQAIMPVIYKKAFFLLLFLCYWISTNFWLCFMSSSFALFLSSIPQFKSQLSFI